MKRWISGLDCKLILSTVVIGLSAAAMCWQLVQPLKIKSLPQAGLGRGVAEETAKVLGYRGRVVVVAWDTGIAQERMAAREFQLQEFIKAIEHLGVVEVEATERVGLSQLDGRTMRLSGVFGGILQRHPQADAVVSFVGVPDLGDDEIAQLGRPLPKFVVVTDMVFGLKKFFQRKVVTLAIVPRYDKTVTNIRPPQTERARFDRTHQVVTPDTLDSLPAPPVQTRR